MRRLYLQQIQQHGLTYCIGKADPRDLVRIATEIEVGTTQDAQRPLNGKRVRQIASYVDVENGLLPNTLVLATKNENLQVHNVHIADETGTNLGLYYIDFPVTDEEYDDYKNSIDVMDGQHRLYSFGDDYRTLNDDVMYEIGFTLFVTPTLREQRMLFMVCNEKQEKVSGNLLMWFKEKLNLLQGAELEFNHLVQSLNSENASPLKGRIIMGGESFTYGIKAQQLIRVFDKSKIQNLTIAGAALNDEQLFKLICTYLKGWESVCDFKLSAPNAKTDGAAYKIAGIRYMMLLLPTFWDRSISQKVPFTQGFVEDTLKQFLSLQAIEYSEFFTCDSQKVYFKGESAIFSFAERSIAQLKSMDSGEFNPLA